MIVLCMLLKIMYIVQTAKRYQSRQRPDNTMGTLARLNAHVPISLIMYVALPTQTHSYGNLRTEYSKLDAIIDDY